MAHCDNCHNDLIFEETPNSVHYGKTVCSHCGKFFGWVKSPKHEGTRTKTSRYDLNQVAQHYDITAEPYCFFCLRVKNRLGLNETLTIDHISELSKSGEDKLNNLQILCSACHKLKNWVRLYVNWHIVK